MSGPYYANKAVGEGRMKAIGETAKSLVPERLRSAGKGAIEKYADWVQSAPLKNSVPQGAKYAEDRTMNAVGKVANAGARAVHEPENEWLERNQTIRAMKERDDAEPAPVTQMASVDVEGDGPIVSMHPANRVGISGTKPAIPQPHNKPMTHEQLVAKAQKMMEDAQSQHEAQMSAGPAVQDVDRDTNGMALPSWLRTAATP